MSRLRGAFDWVPRPVAREFWWIVVAFCLSTLFLGFTGGSPRMGNIGGTPVALGTEEGLLDGLGYWAFPVIFGAVYAALAALRLVVRRVRGDDVDRVAREIRERRSKRGDND